MNIMNWLILLNFIAALFSLLIIQRGFVNVNPYELMAGVILLIINVGHLGFNLARKLFDK